MMKKNRAKRLQVQNRFIARSLVHNWKMKSALNVEIYTLVTVIKFPRNLNVSQTYLIKNFS